MTKHFAARATLRPVLPDDFDYCARLYFEGMETIIKELNLNMDAQLASVRQHWKAPQVRIITLDGSDIGWLQSFVKGNELFLAYRRGQRLDRGGSESRPAGHTWGGEDKPRPAAV